jgi:hypothetical protein
LPTAARPVCIGSFPARRSSGQDLASHGTWLAVDVLVAEGNTGGHYAGSHRLDTIVRGVIARCTSSASTRPVRSTGR